MKKLTAILFLLTAILVVGFVSPVVAQENSVTNSSANTSDEVTNRQAIKDRIQKAKERNQEIRENMRERASAAAQKRAEKLSQARLKVCQARQRIIENRLKNLRERAILIHKAHERAFNLADKFYTEKLVPNGYTLSNYTDLKTEVETNKASVQALLDSAEESGGQFDCSSDDPKGQVDVFKEDMRALIEANKIYKDSIHNFVRAVRDLAKTARIEKLSVTPTPEEGDE